MDTSSIPIISYEWVASSADRRYLNKSKELCRAWADKADCVTMSPSHEVINMCTVLYLYPYLHVRHIHTAKRF